MHSRTLRPSYYFRPQSINHRLLQSSRLSWQTNNERTRILLSSPQIISATSLGSTLVKELGKCPSDIYVIVSQPGVNALDYSGQHSTPHLDRWISGEDKDIRTSYTVSDVLGELDIGALVRTLEKKCGAGTLTVDASSKFSWTRVAWRRAGLTLHCTKHVRELANMLIVSAGLFDIVDDMRPRIIRMDFPSLPGGDARSAASRTNGIYRRIKMLTPVWQLLQIFSFPTSSTFFPRPNTVSFTRQGLHRSTPPH